MARQRQTMERDWNIIKRKLEQLSIFTYIDDFEEYNTHIQLATLSIRVFFNLMMGTWEVDLFSNNALKGSTRSCTTPCVTAIFFLRTRDIASIL